MMLRQTLAALRAICVDRLRRLRGIPGFDGERYV